MQMAQQVMNAPAVLVALAARPLPTGLDIEVSDGSQLVVITLRAIRLTASQAQSWQGTSDQGIRYALVAGSDNALKLFELGEAPAAGPVTVLPLVGGVLHPDCLMLGAGNAASPFWLDYRRMAMNWWTQYALVLLGLISAIYMGTQFHSGTAFFGTLAIAVEAIMVGRTGQMQQDALKDSAAILTGIGYRFTLVATIGLPSAALLLAFLAVG